MTRLANFSSAFIISAGLLLLAPASATPNQLPTCEDLGIDLNQDSCRTYCSSLGYDGVTNPGSSLVTSSSTSSCMCKGMNDNTLEAICQSATATATATALSPSPTPDASTASPTPIYSPKSTCESMDITNMDECRSTCDKYFPISNPSFGPFRDGELQQPAACNCKNTVGPGVHSGDRYVCGATTDVYFTCKDVNVTDVNTCDDVCKQDTSSPGTTFHGAFNEEHSMCECIADVPNSDVFNYCGGPPPPPASGVLPTCGSMGILSGDACEYYCRDYARIDYPKFQPSGNGAQCLCSTGAGCVEGNEPSSGRKLGAWVSSLMMLTATVMTTVL